MSDDPYQSPENVPEPRTEMSPQGRSALIYLMSLFAIATAWGIGNTTLFFVVAVGVVPAGALVEWYMRQKE